jgi:hypothetical protein
LYLHETVRWRPQLSLSLHLFITSPGISRTPPGEWAGDGQPPSRPYHVVCTVRHANHGGARAVVHCGFRLAYALRACCISASPGPLPMRWPAGWLAWRGFCCLSFLQRANRPTCKRHACFLGREGGRSGSARSGHHLPCWGGLWDSAMGRDMGHGGLGGGWVQEAAAAEGGGLPTV